MAASFKIPEFESMAVDIIPAIASNARNTFRTNKTKNLKWRLVQLRKLYWAVEDYRPQLLAALQKDLRKAEYEAILSEIDWVKNDCMFMIDNCSGYTVGQNGPVR